MTGLASVCPQRFAREPQASCATLALPWLGCCPEGGCSGKPRNRGGAGLVFLNLVGADGPYGALPRLYCELPSPHPTDPIDYPLLQLHFHGNTSPSQMETTAYFDRNGWHARYLLPFALTEALRAFYHAIGNCIQIAFTSSKLHCLYRLLFSHGSQRTFVAAYAYYVSDQYLVWSLADKPARYAMTQNMSSNSLREY